MFLTACLAAFLALFADAAYPGGLINALWGLSLLRFQSITLPQYVLDFPGVQWTQDLPNVLSAIAQLFSFNLPAWLSMQLSSGTESGHLAFEGSLKAIAWGLPIFGLGLLKKGYDDLSAYATEVVDHESRIKVLDELSAIVTLGKRFTTNIKAALDPLRDVDRVKAQFMRLLSFEHAPTDIDQTRRSVQAAIDKTKSELARKAAFTGAIAFIFASQGVLGRLEPKSTQQDHPERLTAKMEQMSEAEKKELREESLWTKFMTRIEKCKRPGKEGEGTELSCTKLEKERWINLLFAERQRKLDSGTADSLTVRLDPDYIGPLQSRITNIVRDAVTYAANTADVGRLSANVKTAVARAFAEADLSGLNPKTQTEVTNAINAAIVASFWGGLKEPVRTQMTAAIQEAMRASDYRGFRETAGPVMRETFDKAAEDAFVGTIVTRLRPQLIDAINQALAQNYRLSVDVDLPVPPSPPISEALGPAPDLDKIVRNAILQAVASIDKPIPVTVDPSAFIPSVPPQCEGHKIAQVYFPPLANPLALDCPAGDRRCRQSACRIVTDFSQKAADGCNGSDTANFKDLVDKVKSAISGSNGKQELLAIGYADSSGMPTTNLWVSANRARLVSTELRKKLCPEDGTQNCLVSNISAIGRGEEVMSQLPQQAKVPAESGLSRRADVYLCPL